LAQSRTLISKFFTPPAPEIEDNEGMLEGLLRPQHLFIILLVAFFVFGGKKLPELGRGLGEGLRGFKESFKGASEPEELVKPKDPVVPPQA
jgi:sec-independent protein translocase protein TatA